MKDKKKSDAGKRGMSSRWSSRYELLKELSKYYTKKELEWFTKGWTTDQLKTLHEKISKIKRSI